jgi:hypothetical protein
MASPSDHYTPEQRAALQHVEQAEKEATRIH